MLEKFYEMLNVPAIYEVLVLLHISYLCYMFITYL